MEARRSAGEVRRGAASRSFFEDATPPQIERSRLFVCTLATTVLLAATGFTWSVIQWQALSERIRFIAEDPKATDAERTDAIVALQRDTRANIACLRRITGHGGTAAQHAHDALASVEEALR